MSAIRPKSTYLDSILARRAEGRFAAVSLQALGALNKLRGMGVEIEFVGSFARGDFRENSDVDFLITNRGTLSETDIFSVVSDCLKLSSFDLSFADHMSPESVALMRTDAVPKGLVENG